MTQVTLLLLYHEKTTGAVQFVASRMNDFWTLVVIIADGDYLYSAVTFPLIFGADMAGLSGV